MNEMVRSTVRLFKRIFPVMLATLLLLAFSSQALAASDKSQNSSAKTSSETGTSEHGNSGNKKEKQVKNTEQTEETTRYQGISVEKITLAIDSVSDEATKAELAELLEAYTTALENKDGAIAAGTGLSELAQAASDARKALKGGLEEAGFTLGSILGWQEWKEWPSGTALDLDQIVAAIAALDDLDGNKEALTALMTAYQDALAAEGLATDENKEALEEATKTARDALLEALFEAGLLPLEESVPADEEPAEQE